MKCEEQRMWLMKLAAKSHRPSAGTASTYVAQALSLPRPQSCRRSCGDAVRNGRWGEPGQCAARKRKRASGCSRFLDGPRWLARNSGWPLRTNAETRRACL